MKSFFFFLFLSLFFVLWLTPVCPCDGHSRRHTFKLLPNIGKHVVELLEGTLAPDLAQAWRWRPGGDALKSRRAAPAKDLADMPGWNHDPPVSKANL